VHPQSSFTAAVQDIMDGLVDMSVGPFWITSEFLNILIFPEMHVIFLSYA